MSCSPHKYQFQIQNTLTVPGWSCCFTGCWEPLNLACAYLQDLKITSQIPRGTVINHIDTRSWTSSARTRRFLTKSLLPVNYLFSCLCLKKVWHDLRLLLEFPDLFICVGHRFGTSQSYLEFMTNYFTLRKLWFVFFKVVVICVQWGDNIGLV